MSDNPQDLAPTKIEANIPTADDQWKERGRPRRTLLARMFEIDANPALANDPEFLRELHESTTAELAQQFRAMEASAAAAVQAIAAYFPPPDLQSSFVAMQASCAKIWQNSRWMDDYAKMAVGLADLNSKSMEASATVAANAIAAFLSPSDIDLSFVHTQSSLAKVWQNDAWMGRYAETAFKLEAECLKAEEVWKTLGQVTGFQIGGRIIEEMQCSKSLSGSSAIEALLSRDTLRLDLGLAALCNIGSSKATAAKPRPVPDRHHLRHTQPSLKFSLETCAHPTTANPIVVNTATCSTSSAVHAASQNHVLPGPAEQEVLRRMVAEGNTAEANRFISKKSREFEKALRLSVRLKHGRPSKPETQTRTYEVAVQIEVLLPEFTKWMSLKEDLEEKYEGHRSARRKIEADLLSLIGNQDKVDAIMLSHKPLTATCRYVSGLPGICLSTDTVQNYYSKYRRKHPNSPRPMQNSKPSS